MRMLLLLYLVGSFLSCTTAKPRKPSFAMIVGSGFHEDTLSIAYNGIPLISNSIVDSDLVTGIVPFLSIVGEKGVIRIKSQVGERNINAKLDDELALLVIKVGQNSSSIPFNTQKGRYLLINHFENSIQLNQYKKPMVFE